MSAVVFDRSQRVRKLDPLQLIAGVRDAFGLLTPGERRRARILSLSMFFNALLGLAGLAGVLPFIDLMLTPQPLNDDSHISSIFLYINVTNVNTAIFFTGLFLILLIILKNIYHIAHTYFQSKFCTDAMTRLASDLLEKFISAPYYWSSSQNSITVRDIIVDQTSIWARGVVRSVLQICNDGLFLALSFGFLIYTDVTAGLAVTFGTALFAVVAIRIANTRIAHLSERRRLAARRAGMTGGEAISGGRDVRISNVAPALLADFATDFSAFGRYDVATRQWQQVPRVSLEIVGFAALIGAALVGLWFGAQRADIAALLAVYAVVAIRTIPIAIQLMGALTTLVTMLPSVAEINDLRRSIPTDNAGTGRCQTSKGDWATLILSHVRFRYDATADRPTVGPLSVQIARGASLGVVGRSGAGKSTFVDIVAGLIAPNDGWVGLDDEELTPARLAHWRSRIAYVSQSPFLLDATLFDNIRFGQPPRADDAEALSAVLAASGLSAVVDALPQGANTLIGERGAFLSGGQRQRVAIARALYRNADIVVMDEATSALDSVTEQEINAQINSLRGKITLLVVAHRLSTVAQLDEILVMDEGLIIARGRHQTLLRSSQAYRAMVEAQTLL